jgi:purine-binding chemotaxis protein CheW
MAEDISYCLFRCGALPLALPVADVAEIVEVDSLVRISFCPPRVAGLCPHHRQVVPVVALGPTGLVANPTSAEKPVPSTQSRSAVLVLQTEQGLWGIKIDREGTVISSDRPARHEPKKDVAGVVTVGLIRHGELDHALLDAGLTWNALRESVSRWYSRFSDPASSSGCLDSHPSVVLDPAVARGSAEPGS